MMTMTEAAKTYHERMFPNYKSKFLETDPEFIERFDNFAFDEVVGNDKVFLIKIISQCLPLSDIQEV